jgi:hypothetical protein
LALGAFAQFNSSFSLNSTAAFLGGTISGTGTLSIGSGAHVEFSSSVAGPTISFSSGNSELRLDNPSTFQSPMAGLALGDAIYLQGIDVASASVSGSTLTVNEANSTNKLTYTVSGALSQNAFSVLFSSASGSEIVLVPSTGTVLTGTSGPLSFTPTTAQFYQLLGETISSSTAIGLSIAASDSNAADTIFTEIDQSSSITVTGAFTALNISTTGANIAITNAGSISSSGGIGIFANSGSGNTSISDYGNVSGSNIGIDAVTTGTGPLAIFVGGTVTITGATAVANSRGIVAITSAGNSNVTTAPGVTINDRGFWHCCGKSGDFRSTCRQ